MSVLPVFAAALNDLAGQGNATAIEGRAPRLDQPAHDAPAPRRGAGLALPVIDPEIVLEIAERAIGVRVIPQRRAARGNRLLENLPDDSGKAVGGGSRRAILAGQRSGGP